MLSKTGTQKAVSPDPLQPIEKLTSYFRCLRRPQVRSSVSSGAAPNTLSAMESVLDSAHRPRSRANHPFPDSRFSQLLPILCLRDNTHPYKLLSSQVPGTKTRNLKPFCPGPCLSLLTSLTYNEGLTGSLGGSFG